MMRRALVVFSLSLAAAVSAEEEFVVVPHPALPGEVPAGSREDQILWRDARDAMVEGNQAVHPDPGITISQSWMRQGEGVVNNRATDRHSLRSSFATVSRSH